jgi:arsenate-mycothiol transferase
MSHISSSFKPNIVFVCVKNGGKSKMAAALMEYDFGEHFTITSAGTSPGVEINKLSAQVLSEIGIDINSEKPNLLTDKILETADLVIVLGSEARVQKKVGIKIETWKIEEPSFLGIDGYERMIAIRKDIHSKVKNLAQRLM